MGFYLVEVVYADSFGEVSFEELGDQRFDLDWEMAWKSQLSWFDVLVKYLDGLIKIWWHSNHHFIKNAADSINIRRKAYPFLIQHFRREISWTATKRHRKAILPTQAKVSQPNIPITANQNILRLQISIQYLIPMQILHSQNQLSYDKPSSILTQVLSSTY